MLHYDANLTITQAQSRSIFLPSILDTANTLSTMSPPLLKCIKSSSAHPIDVPSHLPNTTSNLHTQDNQPVPFSNNHHEALHHSRHSFCHFRRRPGCRCLPSDWIRLLRECGMLQRYSGGKVLQSRRSNDTHQDEGPSQQVRRNSIPFSPEHRVHLPQSSFHSLTPV
jgi:hypothetical protein